jgi:hypothetical protein
MWRCPHCGAPQAESARCWVCRRSSTTCSTCRHFQTALSADSGWCALDPKRLRLTGLEQRGCWQGRQAASPTAPAEVGLLIALGPRQPTSSHNDAASAPARIDFIPVELMTPSEGAVETAASEHPEVATSAPESMAALMHEPEETWVERTSLFGELEA